MLEFRKYIFVRFLIFHSRVESIFAHDRLSRLATAPAAAVTKPIPYKR